MSGTDDNAATHERNHRDCDDSDGLQEGSIMPMKGKCDVCQKKDGFQGHRLLKCHKCNMCIHENCYGLVVKVGRKDINWECYACEAVGKEVLVSKPGRRSRTVLQENRPHHCCLCSHHLGNHAMHPLYDEHGPEGRQLVLNADQKQNLPKRLAWVHSICAFFIASNKPTQGCVYGCDEKGDYDDDGEESESEEELGDDSDSSALSDGRESKKSVNRDDNKAEKEKIEEAEAKVFSIHHFVIAYKEGGEENAWTRRIKECRGLKCEVCGEADNDGYSRRIPVQCSAGSEHEYAEFKGRHEGHEINCCQAMHVGCALWGQNIREKEFPYKFIYFYPGLQVGVSGENSEPVTECYCPLHAQEIHDKNPRRKEREMRNRQPVLGRRDRAALRQNQRSQQTKPHRGSKMRDPGSQRGIINDTQFTATDRLSPAKRKITNVGSPGDISESHVKQIVNDVVEKVRVAFEEGKNAKDVTKKCREYWKLQMGLPDVEWKKMWKTIKVAVENAMDSESSPSTYAVESMGETSGDNKEPGKRPQSSHAVISSDATIKSSGENRWALLWLPSFSKENKFQFGEWDEYKVKTINSS